jgi:integrase
VPRLRLNPRSVGSLLPPKGRDRTEFFDASEGAPPGFLLRVSTRGGDPARSYVLTYRHHGRKRWLRLGGEEALSLSVARQLAREALVRVARGEDPAGEREETRGALTLAGLVLRYVDHGTQERSAVTTGNYRRQQRALAKAPLGKLPAPAVTRPDIRAHVEALAQESPVQANRVLALIRSTCRWAVGRDLLPADPTAGIARPGAEAPDRRRLEDDELRNLWVGLDAPDAELTPEVKAAIKVMLLVGTRRTETCRMRWADLDLDNLQATWTIPAEDRKGERALVVPLAPAVKDILKGLRARSGKHAYVFAGKRGGPLSSNPNRWAAAVREACGVEFSPHALRRTFARGVAKLGYPSEMVSRLLGHKTAAGTLAVTEGYAEYDFLRERSKVLRAWALHVANIVSGKKPDAKVRPMRPKAAGRATEP